MAWTWDPLFVACDGSSNNIIGTFLKRSFELIRGMKDGGERICSRMNLLVIALP
jgi:hypothetical protein